MARQRRKRRTKTPVPGTSAHDALQARIVPVLEGYRKEAEDARKQGPNARDDKWRENVDLYWNRYSFAGKAAWQAKEVMPDVPAYVDRFAAAMKEALVSAPDGFYTVRDVAGQEDDLALAIKRATDVWLSTCGRNQTGTCIDFPAVFEEQCKLGALKAMSSVVVWRNDIPNGRVAIETVDPSNAYLDPTYRNLYRIRRVELDKHDLRAMAKSRDGEGKPIWNLEGINQMVSHIADEDKIRREEMTGHGQELTSTRKPIVMDEYLATIVDTNGDVIGPEHSLTVVGNERFLLRGPEKNPFWHQKDWYVYAPLVTVPLSVYGRSYMEDFGSLAKTFTKLTNMLLDAVQTSSLKAYALVPAMLMNPEQATTGITPNKTFLLEEGMRAEDFFKALDLGTLPPESFQLWSAMKSGLQEAADQNNISIGQFAPKGRTTASEVNQTMESSSALVRSVAQTVEGRWLNTTLNLTWQTGFQHVKQGDTTIAAAMGPELFGALFRQRRSFMRMPYRFQAYGISLLIQKNRMLRALLQLLQIIAQSEPLLMFFLQQIDLMRLLKLLFNLSDVDLRKLQPSERDRLIAGFGNQMSMAQGRINASPDGNRAVDPNAAAGLMQAIQAAGIGRGPQQQEARNG